jgi:hypothetical protein
MRRIVDAEVVEQIDAVGVLSRDEGAFAILGREAVQYAWTPIDRCCLPRRTFCV